MSGADWILFFASLSTSVGGLCLIYLSWKLRARPFLMAIGWGCLTLALVLAVFANGDRGFAQLASVAMALVSGFLIWKLSQQKVELNYSETRRTADASQDKSNGVLSALSSVWTFIITGPISGAIAFLGAAVIFKLIRPETGSPANAGVAAIIIAILGWGALSTALLIEPRAIRRTLYALGGLLATGLAAFI